MPVWTDTPKIFDVTYPAKIPKRSSVFTVHVQEAGGGPVENAFVCLWKTDEVYLTGFTDSSGNVSFTPSPSTRGTLFVTVTKQNYIPFQATGQCSRSKIFINENSFLATLLSNIQSLLRHG
jgi:hypothetical protein